MHKKNGDKTGMTSACDAVVQWMMVILSSMAPVSMLFVCKNSRVVLVIATNTI